MSLVNKVVDFIINDLKIDINEENKELINKKFYDDIEDKFYWIANGIASKKEYENSLI